MGSSPGAAALLPLLDIFEGLGDLIPNLFGSISEVAEMGTSSISDSLGLDLDANSD